MSIHIGQRIKEEFYKQGISVSVFAKEISKSRNVVYDIFERESIDTDLLNKIGKLLNCDFFSMYSSQEEYLTDSVKHFNESGIPYGKNSEQILALQQQNLSLQTEVVYLKKIIALLEKRQKVKPKKKRSSK